MDAKVRLSNISISITCWEPASISIASNVLGWLLFLSRIKIRAMGLSPEKIINLWSICEVRVMILLSLFLQIILITFGSRRKFTARSWIRIIVWLAYLTADWVATVALGNLVSMQTDSDLRKIWAPFLLLHLGGPDTISANSLEDNELWLRHLLGFVVQVVVAIYVLLQSWRGTALTYIAIPIYITGIIKYGERTRVLRSSSPKQLRDSLLQNISLSNPENLQQPQPTLETHASNLEAAYFLLESLKYLFANLILDYEDHKLIKSLIKKKTAEDCFKLIAIELGFLYDLLYTKASVVYSRLGILLRFISFIASITALVLFSVIVDIHAYSPVDISITYILFIGAVVLEVYAFSVLIFSDWTALWYARLRSTNQKILFCATFSYRSILVHRKRWSKSMGQYNLVNFCIQKRRTGCFGVHKLPWIGDLLLKYRCLTREDVNNDLEETILRQLLEKSNEIHVGGYDMESCKRLLEKRGDYVLEKRDGLHDEFKWSTTKVEFDHSLLIWHIATDICYYSDLDDIQGGDVNKLDSKCRISKCLSDYMLYLLVFNPSILPDGMGEITYSITCEYLLLYVESRFSKFEANEVCKALLNEDKLTSESFLEIGCRLARQLREQFSEREVLWKVVSEVWVEMLTYAAANKGGWKEDGQLLRKGGELITHVRLLMAHVGLNTQYRDFIQHDILPDN